jgi:hypothetical protein
MSKYTVDVSQSIIFCLVFLAMAALVALGKVDADKLQYLLLILVPSPVKPAPTPEVTP